MGISTLRPIRFMMEDSIWKFPALSRVEKMLAEGLTL